ncbi:MAG: hypothetical protein CBB68_00335 [Rhodospirillaceae bacterium TMED8]|nr:hypothetical protein [Magnetovibrio sp.]OUT53337.1 MAG: hypothetical protein CBB68_00335 [Rhodospirillaceae bacterium TMED8]|tara:strand:- start:11335 stop:12483 length:1149 start_codon:yes stop_codon:yes gene_type:complete
MKHWIRVGLGAAGAMFVAMGLGRFSFTAMVPALIETGHLTANEAGWIGGANLTGFLIGAYLSEKIRERWFMLQILRVCIIISIIALLASAVSLGALWLGLCRGVLGVTAGLIMVQGLSLVTAKVSEHQRPVAVAMMFSGVGLGIFLSGHIIPDLLNFNITWAWLGIGVIAIIGSAVAFWGCYCIEPSKTQIVQAIGLRKLFRQDSVWIGLGASYFLFSFGLTPHTLYWVDFLVRSVSISIEAGGRHWGFVGIFAFIGPWAAVWLAYRTNTHYALVITFVILGIGIAIPGFATSPMVLWVSTIIFGAQPGLTTVAGARVRDLATAETMPSVIRAMIIMSAIGAAAGGIIFPALFAISEQYSILFFLAGGAMLVAAICSLLARR